MLNGNSSSSTQGATANNGIQTVTLANDSARTTTFADIVRGASAFYDGRTFKVLRAEKRLILNDAEVELRDRMLASATTDDERKAKMAEFIDGLDASKRVAVVFVTDIEGEDAVIWLSSYTLRNTKLDVAKKPVYRDGNFDTDVYKMLNESKPTDDAFTKASELVQKYAGKTFTVKRKLYTNNYGKTASIPCFHAL